MFAQWCKGWWLDWLDAVGFLTRVPVPRHVYRDDSLGRAAKFFPVIGLLVGASAGAVYWLLDPHLPKLATAGLTLLFLLLLTGALHEDGLADAADGFGGGWTRERTLAIFRDSRIGSYGGAALALSLMLRLVLLAALTRGDAVAVLVAAHVLCRWSTLPLSRWLPAARGVEVVVSGAADREDLCRPDHADDETVVLNEAPGVVALQAADGQGARVARLTTTATLVGGSVFAFGCALAAMRGRGVAAVAVSVLVVVLTGLYYRRRIGGVTGDCFGATNQLTELAVYCCAVWVR